MGNPFECGRMILNMPRIVAGILGLTALASGIFTGSDSLTCVINGGVSAAVGWIVGSIWDGLTKSILSIREEKQKEEEEPNTAQQQEAA